MGRSQHRQEKRARKRPGLFVVFAGVAAVGILGAVTQSAYAGAFSGESEALAVAARIPNDQGHSALCAPPEDSAGEDSDRKDSGRKASERKRADRSGENKGHGGGKSSGAEAADADSAEDAAEGDAAEQDCHTDLGGPSAGDFVDIRSVEPNVREPRVARKGSRGTFVSACGTNAEGHRNPDNFIVAPGVSNGAQHVHDYVGNVSTDGFSSDESLAAAGTTCRKGDQSAYFWPVLRDIRKDGADADLAGGGDDGNVGKILVPADVKLEFRGNPRDRVRAMPRFLRVITGDAKALTNGPANARAAWTCTGFADRVTTKYPLCPKGSQVQRKLDFPSCWDGENTDSANHRAHIVFPAEDGACPRGTRAVPQLRMTLTYNQPPGKNFAVDSFPDQLHNPNTDHADFANVMPENLMREVVDCINRGRRC